MEPIKSQIDILLKEKGCGVYLDDNINTKTVEDYIKNSSGNIRVIIAKGEDIGVSEVDEYLSKVIKEKFNLNSVEELEKKLSEEGRTLFIIFEDIEKLSFHQLKTIEKLCKKAKSKFPILLLGKTQAKELIDSFYFKDLRELATFLIGCGYIRKEKVKEFSENYLKKILGVPVEIEKGVENYLYKFSDKNQKKLENILKDISKHIKGNVLSLDIIKSYFKEKGLSSSEISEETEEKQEKEVKHTKILSGTVLASVLVIVSLISLFLLVKRENNPEGIQREEVAQIEKKEEKTVNQNIIQEENQVDYQEAKIEDTTIQDNEEKKEENQLNEEKKVEEKPLKFVNLKSVKVYEKKGENSKIIGKLKKFQIISSSEVDNDWVKIEKDNLVGWIKKDNLVEITDGKGVVIAGMLNLRDRPGINSIIITSIPKGTVVQIIKEKKFGNYVWLQVIYHSEEGTYQGWVSGKYVLR